MPGEPVCRTERRAGESVVDSGYMEAGGRGCGQPAGGGVLSPGPRRALYTQSGLLKGEKVSCWSGLYFEMNLCDNDQSYWHDEAQDTFIYFCLIIIQLLPITRPKILIYCHECLSMQPL